MPKEISFVNKNSEKDISSSPEDTKVIPFKLNCDTCNLNVSSADSAEICIRLLNFAKMSKDSSNPLTKSPSNIAQASPERYVLKKCSLLGDISETEHNVDRLEEKTPTIDNKNIVSSSLFVKKSPNKRLSLEDKKTTPQKRKYDDIHRNFDGIESETKVAKRSFTENGEVSQHKGANTSEKQPELNFEIVPNQQNDKPDDSQNPGKIILRVKPDLKPIHTVPITNKDVNLHQMNVNIADEIQHNIFPKEFKTVAKTVAERSSKKYSNHKHKKLNQKSKTDKKKKKKKWKIKHIDRGEHSLEEKNESNTMLIKQSIDKPELLNIGNEREGNVVESVTSSAKESRQLESCVKPVQRKIRTDKKTSNRKLKFKHNKITIDKKNEDRKRVKKKLYVDESFGSNSNHTSEKNSESYLSEIAEKMVNDMEYSTPKKAKWCSRYKRYRSNPDSPSEEVAMTAAVGLSELNGVDSCIPEKLQIKLMPVNNEVESESERLEMEMAEYLKKLSARRDKIVNTLNINDIENEEINQEMDEYTIKLSIKHGKSSFLPDNNEIVHAEAIKESAELSDRYILNNSQVLEISNVKYFESTLPDLNAYFSPSKSASCTDSSEDSDTNVDVNSNQISKVKSKIGSTTYVSEKSFTPKNKKGKDSDTTSSSGISDDDLPAVNFNVDPDKTTAFKEDKTHLEISQDCPVVVEEKCSAEMKDKPTNAGTSERNIIIKNTNNNIEISGKDWSNEILKNCRSNPDETANMSSACNSSTTHPCLDCESKVATIMITNESDDINGIELNNQILEKLEIGYITLDEEDSADSITTVHCTEERSVIPKSCLSIEMKNDNIDAFKESGVELIAYQVCGDSIEKLEVPCEKENAVCENFKNIESELSHEKKSTEVDVADECITNEYFKSQDKVLGEETIARNEKLENINVQKMVSTEDAKNLKAGIDNGLNSPEILNVKIERSEKISCTTVVEKSTSSTIGREDNIYKCDELQNCPETVPSENETDQQNATSSQKRYNPKIKWLSEFLSGLICNNATCSEIQNDVEDIISKEKLTPDKVDVYDIFTKLIERLPHRNYILDNFHSDNTKASHIMHSYRVPHNTADNAVNVNANCRKDASFLNEYVFEDLTSITNSSSPDLYKSFKAETEKSDDRIQHNNSQTSSTIDKNPGNSDPAVSISVLPKAANSQLRHLLSNFQVNSSQHTECTSINSEVQRSSPNSKDSDSFVTQLHDSIPFDHNQNNSTILHKSCNLSADLLNSGAQFNKNDGNVPKDNMNNLNTHGSDPAEKLAQLEDYLNTLKALFALIDNANEKINYVIENTKNNKNGNHDHVSKTQSDCNQIYTDGYVQETSASYNNNVPPNNNSTQQIIQKYLIQKYVISRNNALYLQRILIHNKQVMLEEEEGVESVNSGMRLSKPQLLKILQHLKEKIPSAYYDNRKHVLIHNVANPHISEKETHANYIVDNSEFNQRQDTGVQAQQPPRFKVNPNNFQVLPSGQLNSHYDKCNQPYPPHQPVWITNKEKSSNVGGYPEVVHNMQSHVTAQQAYYSNANCNNQQLPNNPSNGFHDKCSEPDLANQHVVNSNCEQISNAGSYPEEALQRLHNNVQAQRSIVNSNNPPLANDLRNGYYDIRTQPCYPNKPLESSDKDISINGGGYSGILQSQLSYVQAQPIERSIVNSNNEQLPSDPCNGYYDKCSQPYPDNQPVVNSNCEQISNAGSYPEEALHRLLNNVQEQRSIVNPNNEQLANYPHNGYYDTCTQPYHPNKPVKTSNNVGSYSETLQSHQSYVPTQPTERSIFNSNNEQLPSYLYSGYYDECSQPDPAHQPVVNSNSEKISNAGSYPEEALQRLQNNVQAQHSIVNSNNQQLPTDLQNGCYCTSVTEPLSHNHASSALNTGTVNVSSNQFQNQTTKIVPQEIPNQLSPQNVNTSTVPYFPGIRNISDNFQSNSPSYQNLKDNNLNIHVNVDLNTTPNHFATGPQINVDMSFNQPQQYHNGGWFTDQDVQQANSFQNNQPINVNYMNAISTGVHNKMQNAYNYPNTTPQRDLHNSYNMNINAIPKVMHGNLSDNQVKMN